MKHSLYGKIAASVLLRLFVSGNERCHTTEDRTLSMANTLKVMCVIQVTQTYRKNDSDITVIFKISDFLTNFKPKDVFLWYKYSTEINPNLLTFFFKWLPEIHVVYVRPQIDSM